MTDFLLLAFIFLVAGVVTVPIASRLALGSVLGYLIAGIAISPVLALLHVDVVSIQHFAEFGVVMMLFLVGLELEPKMLWSMRARLLGLGGGQVVLTALAVMGISMAFGLSWTVALTVGMILALSSTAIVLQTLNEKGLMRSDGGQSSFSVLLMQDIAVIPMLAFIPLLAMPELVEALHQGASAEAGGHGGSLSLVDGLNGWQTALVTLGAIGVVVVGGSYLVSPIFRFIAAAQLRELFTAGALLLVIGIALLMSLVGVSPALGTFIAGVLLANSPYKHELESDVDPFRGLLLGLFFMTVGAGIDFGLLFANFLPIVGLTLGLILVKVAVLLALGYVFRVKGADKWLFALGLAQAGEFGFVLLSFTVSNGVIPDELAGRLLLIVALSMLLTPLLFILYERLIAPRYSATEEREPDTMPEGRRIIIAGAGRVGGLLNRILRVGGFESVVIDYSTKRLDAMARFGVRHHYGDATRPDLLHAAGIAEAKLLIVAIDDREQISELVKYAVANYPHLHVMARATDRDHVYDLWAHGCRDIIRETYDGTLRMGRSAFVALGIEPSAAQKMVDAFNEKDREAMVSVADVYQVGVPVEENEAYIARVREVFASWETDVKDRLQAIREGRD